MTLSGLAGPGGKRNYLSHDSGPLSMPSYVDVASISKTASFTIKASSVSVKTVVHICATLGNQVSTTLTITP